QLHGIIPPYIVRVIYQYTTYTTFSQEEIDTKIPPLGGFIKIGCQTTVKAQNQELLREENLKQIEELLKTALDKAKQAGVSVDELVELIKALE
ncbi:MAG: hypothetical protein IJM34_05395, partial [Lachnospiraceae bacterium]|nr:hypothetical protein [Lachnospiraceae bacterium]